MSDAAEALAAELSGKLPPEFLSLTDAQLRHLTDALRVTRATQIQALEDSTEQSIKNLPFPLRGPARMIVGS